MARKHSAAQLGFDLREIKELGGASVEDSGFAVSWYKQEATVYRSNGGTGWRVFSRGTISFEGEGNEQRAVLLGSLGNIPRRTVEALEDRLTERLCRQARGGN